METQLMDLKKIEIDDRLQSRAQLDENIVDEYANAITDGAKFPPPVVFFDGSTRWLASGFHRYFAHKLAGQAGIKVELRKGTLREAILFSVGENQTHGLRRTTADKRRAVMLLLEDEVWSQWSDREISAKTGTSHTFVSQLRNPEKTEAKKAASGNVATPKSPPPTSKPGITISSPPPPAVPGKPVQSGNVATKSQVIHNPDDASDDHGDDPVAILSAEVDRLAERLAVAAMEGYTDEEKAAFQTGLKDLQDAYQALKAERDSIATQRDAYMRENAELKSEIGRMRKKLDRALEKA